MDNVTQAHDADTQWSRWEVFKQDTPKKPHQAVGSVHAVDAEHALLAARNVFARRPSAVSMWVAPAEAVFAVTAEELARSPERYVEDTAPQAAPERYLVFRKANHRQSLAFVDHIGEVEAASAQQALWKAVEGLDDEPALVWWLVPERVVARSHEDDAESWFAPAKTKTYKQQSEYGLVGSRGGRRTHGRGH